VRENRTHGSMRRWEAPEASRLSPCGYRRLPPTLVQVAYPAYLRERARELRTTKHMSLDEIAERLALPKTTVYYWIKDLPLGRARRWSPGQRKGNGSMRMSYRVKREAAYAQGLAEYDELMLEPTFRDFVVLYIAEGYKRSRNTASISNSDPAIVKLAVRWMTRLAARPPVVRVQHHVDQDVDELRAFWTETLGVERERVRFQPKSNSGQLRSRVWRCAHGVAAVDAYDTLLRARIQAWIDRTREAWG
jgi:AcrR family transcriptional regulator